MNQYIQSSFSCSKIEQELSDPFSEFYLALVLENVAGYLKVNLSHTQTELKGENSLEIQKIYVLKEFFGRNTEKVLPEKAVSRAKIIKKDHIWLGVWEKNPRAIRFYEKNSFVKFGTHDFFLGNDKQTDILMRFDLNNI